jgi:hypothetical protein
LRPDHAAVTLAAPPPSAAQLSRSPNPWVIVQQIINRNGVVANVVRDERTGIAATALRLEIICGR